MVWCSAKKFECLYPINLYVILHFHNLECVLATLSVNFISLLRIILIILVLPRKVMTTWQSLYKENQEMVDKFTRLAIIQSKEVEKSFRCVSRAAFVSKDLLDESFMDAPIRGSPHIHMSAPHMYAAILEDLELEPGIMFFNLHQILY